MKIKFKKPFNNPVIRIIYFVSIVLITVYFFQTYVPNKGEIIECKNCHCFKDQWNTIKSNPSINKNAKVLSCWLYYDKASPKPTLKIMLINKNKFHRFQYVDAICRNDEINLEFNGTYKNLQNEFSKGISTDEFMTSLDTVWKNAHNIFKTPSSKYSLFVTSKHSNSITKQSNAFYIGKNGVLTKVPEKDFPLKDVNYMNCSKLDEHDKSSEIACIILK
ncbi:hypothetical protein Z969_05280 [Clostridium novyi A str. 4570]|uniref:Uncharacterized protein n=1 Tax=Clostridium novyi A str. 4570 TaxID=1444290 RepID=A0AA89CMW1_CLONO|nr:hypothetical protein [Clostridium novyi]KGN02494.1 hypothetical protein Z969_05280 [Clostridium novyi A str. 4570]